MPYALGAKSLKELEGVHPDLVRVVKRAIGITGQDFSLHDGLRTEAEQREYVRRGVSKTMNSMHRVQPDGYGHAFDAVPWINGKLRWEWPPIYVIASAVRIAAETEMVPMIWGAVWDRKLLDLPKTPEGLKREVDAYVARRKKMGKSAFIDGPHFQLA